MNSIRNKFILLITISMTALTLLLGTASIIMFNRMAVKDSTIIINGLSKEQGAELNEQLALVSKSVETIYAYSNTLLLTTETLEDEASRNQYMGKIMTLAVDVANNTNDAIAVYFRLAPEVCGDGKGGFFFTKLKDVPGFNMAENTDILLYDEDDIEHVGWYYLPLQNEKPMWLEPYYNKNLDVEMISYIIPFYKNGTFVGVIGMDIDFSGFVGTAEDITIYETGMAALMSPYTETVFYLSENDEVLFDAAPERFVDELVGENSESALLDFVFKNERVKLAYQTLDNGMKLAVFAPVKEIYKERNRMVVHAICLLIFMLLTTLTVSILMTGRVVKPLKELTEATKRFADGDWDFSMECNTKDEVKTLTDSVVKMAHTTQKYIAEINSMAYQDGLTKLKNKACFIDYSEKIRKNENGAWNEYAIVVFDVNYLKQTNDKYGHEMGDVLLTKAGKRICDTFKHSPIFRIGGDEFAAILSGEDYENRKNLLTTFREGMENSFVGDDGEIKLSIASGMTSCPKYGDDFDALFNLADHRMYENKEMIKNGKAL